MNIYKAKRLYVGLSRKDAAKELKISCFHLRNIENDQREPSKQLAYRMSLLYKCELLELLKLL